MRRFFAIVLVAIYTLLSTGLTLHLHYCMGNLKHVSVASDDMGCCKTDHSCEGSEIHSSCCSDQNINFELEGEQSRVPEFYWSAPAVLLTAPEPIALYIPLKEEELNVYHTDSGPPLKRPLYQLYSCYTLYA
ncbi:MAG: HYC_CC_PP family protein [Flavobacteriales bacterium]